MGKRKSAAAVAADIEQTEPTATETTETSNGGPTMTSAATELPIDDTLPLEIPDNDLKPVIFNHAAVRCLLSNPRIEKAKESDFWARPGKDTYAFMYDLFLREDQPDHPELAEMAGMRISFNRLPIVPGQQSLDMYLALMRAYSLNPKAPDLSVITDVPVIARIVTKITQDEDGNDRPPRHNVYKLTRDKAYEDANGGGQ